MQFSDRADASYLLLLGHSKPKLASSSTAAPYTPLLAFSFGFSRSCFFSHFVQVTAFQSVPSSHPEAARGGGAGLDGGQLVSYSSEALAGLDTPTKEAIRLSAEGEGVCTCM